MREEQDECPSVRSTFFSPTLNFGRPNESLEQATTKTPDQLTRRRRGQGKRSYRQDQALKKQKTKTTNRKRTLKNATEVTFSQSGGTTSTFIIRVKLLESRCKFLFPYRAFRHLFKRSLPFANIQAFIFLSLLFSKTPVFTAK